MTNEELVEKYQNGNKEVLGQIIDQNTNLVHYVLKRNIGIPRCHNDYEDMFQAGCMGLMRAADKYDVKLGLSFSTFAVRCIRTCIERESGNLYAMRLPSYMKTIIWKTNRVANCMAEKGMNCSDEEIAAECGISVQTYLLSKRMQEDVISLNAAINENAYDDLCLLDVTPDPADMENRIVQSLFCETILSKAKEILSDKEYDIICRRFGFEGHTNATLDEIGDVYGLSRERIRQIEREALKKLREDGYFSDAL